MASSPADAILRNTLRCTISATEYATLHRYVLSRSRALRRAVPAPARTTHDGTAADDDYNARAVRHALRVFLAVVAGIKGWEAVVGRVRGGGGRKPGRAGVPA
ncbi:hypothetical protein E4U53_004740, partial [Claviceps sorghi]